MGEVTAAVGESLAAPGAAAGNGQPRHWRALYSRYGALAGYLGAGLAVAVGWLGRDERNINAEYGLGYALGIAGGSLMLLLLLYSVRKRVRILARFGATRHWFRIHMMLGIAGPTLILYHCNFAVGDLNSKVALYCTLLVAASGVVGRYLYAGIHQGLYGRRTSLRELVADLQGSTAEGHASAVVAPLRVELAALDQQVLVPPATLVDSVTRSIAVGRETRRTYRRLLVMAQRELAGRAQASPAMARHAPRLEQSIRHYLQEHLAQVRRVARFNTFERLFALWHVVHVPFFLMMIVTALFHVFAVHFF